MAQDPPTDVANEYTIISAMNGHGGMTVVDNSTNTTYQIVEYDSEALRSELASREIDETVSLRLDRAGVRANVWRAARAEPVALAA